MNDFESFRNVMHQAGLAYDSEIVADGKLHRFKAEGDHAANSWYVLYSNERAAGAFGCWKRGIKETWCERGRSKLSLAERKELQRQIREGKANRDKDEAERHKEAREIAALIMDRSKPAQSSHPYLVRKSVKPNGRLMQDADLLIVPLCDPDGTLHSLQKIAPDKRFNGERDKTFLPGGRVAGCYFVLADKSDGPVIICEGYATGASGYEATGYAVVCAMAANNLLAVAKALRAKWPDRDIIIAADNDAFTKDKDGNLTNPGLKKATEAAKAIGARLAVPHFKDISNKPTDFNDLHKQEGADAVKAQIEASEGSEASLTPCPWFKKKFPGLAERYGEPALERKKNDEPTRVVDICEDFMAATLGEEAQPNTPTVYEQTQDRFYTYEPAEGVFVYRREAELFKRLSNLLLECARACREHCDVSKLEFGMRDQAALTGVTRKAQAILKVDADFFNHDLTEFIPVGNGMLRVADKELLPFSPTYRRRNKLAVPYDPQAKCPLFLDTLMRPALDEEDINLLQRWFGLALVGINLAQRIMMLTGTPGGGKGVFVRVVCGIIGRKNLETLRTKLLNERFELSRFLGCTLLYGADVPNDFLNTSGASVLKSLTGGDPMTVEKKNSNESPEISGQFNAIITANSRLKVYLEGDTDAWRRRLAIVHYTRPKPDRVIPDLSERILKEEGAGVLNWALEGLDQLKVDGWQLKLTDRQQRMVDDLLLESDGSGEFVRQCLVKSAGVTLTLNDAYAAYVEFCHQRRWAPISRNHFGRQIPNAVTERHGVTLRHDIKDGSGKYQQGWKGLGLISSAERSPEKASEASETMTPTGFTGGFTGLPQVVTPEKAPELVEELF